MKARSTSSTKRPASRVTTSSVASTTSRTRSTFSPTRPRSTSQPAALPIPSPSLSSSSKSLLLEDLQLQLNGLLLQLIEREQVAEDERDRLLSAVANDGERYRLERIFGVERGRGWERLMAMKKDHEVELALKMQQLGMIEGGGDSEDIRNAGRADEWEEKSQLSAPRSRKVERPGTTGKGAGPR